MHHKSNVVLLCKKKGHSCFVLLNDEKIIQNFNMTLFLAMR